MLRTVVLLVNIYILSYYGLLTREPFSYSVVWVGIVPKPVGEGTITFPDNTIGERFPREKYIINLVHNMSNT
jgi:hypothetical protein